MASYKKIAHEEFHNWYKSRLNRLRMELASIFLGKKGWQIFSKAYLDTRIGLGIRKIESEIPQTWEQAARLIPRHIEILEEISKQKQTL